MLKRRVCFILIGRNPFLRTGCLKKSDLPTSCGIPTSFEKKQPPIGKIFFFENGPLFDSN